MFKKKCFNCNGKIDKNYEFCPHCGRKVSNLKENEYGLLGKTDLERDELKLPVGFNLIFNSLVKTLDKQFKELDKEIESIKKKPQKSIKKSSGISISITSNGNMPPKIEVTTSQPINSKQEKKEAAIIGKNVLNKSKISKLPKEEPITNVRRFSNKVVYEIDMPGVESLDDISIIQLENSIEIKGISKDKTYFKLIPINLPVTKYGLKNQKLVLELDSEE